MREGDWKLLAYRSGTAKLYNIGKDMKEEHNLAKVHREKVRKLLLKLVAWEKEMGVAKYSGVQ